MDVRQLIPHHSRQRAVRTCTVRAKRSCSCRRRQPQILTRRPKTRGNMSDKADAQFRIGEAAWVVILMSVCFGFSYLDRNVLTILTQPIKHSLLLNETQLGCLGGVCFSRRLFFGGLSVGCVRLSTP